MEDVGDTISAGNSIQTPLNKSQISNGIDNPYRTKSSLSKQASLDSNSKEKRSLSTLPKSTASPYQQNNHQVFGQTGMSLMTSNNQDQNTSFTSKIRNSFVDEKALKMLSAKHNLEQKRLQMNQLEARIKKLQLEEQKTMKRVNDAKRQQTFVTQIKSLKQEAAVQKQTYIQWLKQEEEENRRKILETRNANRRNLNKSYGVVNQSNQQNGYEIREQAKRIKDSIEQSKHTMLSQKQKAFIEHKTSVVSNNHQRQNFIISNTVQKQKDYISKIDKHHEEANEIERKLRELEKHEQEMLGKLQNTIMLERKEIIKLEEKKNVKIEGSRARIDGYLGVSDKRKIEALDRAEKTIKDFNLDKTGGEIRVNDFFANSQITSIKTSDAQLYEFVQQQIDGLGFEKEGKLGKDLLMSILTNIELERR